MMSFRLALDASIVAIVLVISVSTASAHYLWVTVDSTAGDRANVNVIFEEAPNARDGGYLDPIVERGKTRIRTLDSETSRDLDMTDTHREAKRWLMAPLTEPPPWSIESHVEWGVYRYGEIDALLYYYAKHLRVQDHDELHELGHSDRLDLDIVPHDAGETLELQVIWRKKAAVGSRVFIHGPNGFRKTLTTDAAGKVKFQPTADGMYRFRTGVVEPEAGGEYRGKTYQQTRHSATLIMRLPID
jgi:hypothetical protein